MRDVLIREPGELFADEIERLAYWSIACTCDAPATHYRIVGDPPYEHYCCRDCFEVAW
jgi:hypothetical protein